MPKTTSLLGRRIRQRLMQLGGPRAGYTQSWLAEKLEVSNESVSKWLSGKNEPTLANLRAAALHLRCTIGYLVDETDDTPPNAQTAENSAPSKLLDLAKRMANLPPDRLVRMELFLCDQEKLTALETPQEAADDSR